MSGNSNPQRQNRSFLAAAEQAAIRAILPRILGNVDSLDLTVFGMIGSAIASVGLVGCRWTNWFLIPVTIGVVMNWFGDSLDGSLAQFRKQERPRFGFLVDHTCDLFSQIMIIVAFGLSPFLSLISALVVLLCYLLFSAYTYIRAATHNVHQMAYIGVGATEFRILMVAWSCLGAALGLKEPVVGSITMIDTVVLGLGAVAVVGLGVKAVRDAHEIAAVENEAIDESRRLKAEAMENDTQRAAVCPADQSVF